MFKNCLTIGVVDDEPSVCKALSRLITSAGFNVNTYDSARAFLNDDRSEEPDLLVLDVRMPGMNGLDLQNHLAASGRTIPIVFITAHENGMTKTTAMAAGAVAFFQKPFDEKDLLGAIHKALNLKNT
ncbi:response regulator [Thermodesulfobacteriota bacterium]